MKRVGAVGSALALMLVGPLAGAEDPAAVMLGEPAPAFSLNEVRTGETHSLEDFRGQFVVLHFGASW
ncbi:MAG: hypothetical protein LJF30_08665 [Acidobacteria bacterium]|nr:hypothetical protein [Acidobacteriota bacterium]